MDNRIQVRCLECGKKWKTASTLPQCSRCNSVDVETAEEYPVRIELPKPKITHYGSKGAFQAMIDVLSEPE